jgi:hypothetical protein
VVRTGENAVYDGDEPTKEGEWVFNGWSVDTTNVTTDIDCYAQFKSTNIYTWDAVRAAVNDGTYKDIYKIGDMIPINIASIGSRNMEIVAFDADIKADGSGKAAITWIVERSLCTHAMNSTTIEGGWRNSEMRSWLQNDVYNGLPDDVRSAIVPVQKGYLVDGYSTPPSDMVVDNVWLPSAAEIANFTNEPPIVNYTERFPDQSSRRKLPPTGSSYVDWWLRSAVSSTNFRGVVNDGSLKNISATNTLHVMLGFCT